MAQYKMQGPSGKVYTLEADSQDAAVSAVLQIDGGASGGASSPGRADIPGVPAVPVLGGTVAGGDGAGTRTDPMAEWAAKYARMNKGSRLGQEGPAIGAENLLQSMTFNYADDIAKFLGMDKVAENINRKQKEFSAAHPVANVAYDIIGTGATGVGTGAGIAKASPKLARMLSVMGRGKLGKGIRYAGYGAAPSALAESGKEDSTVGDILSAGATGAGLGAVVGGGADKITQLISKARASKPFFASSDSLRKISKPYFESAKNAVLEPKVSDALIEDVLKNTELKTKDGTLLQSIRDVDPTAYQQTRLMGDKLYGHTSRSSSYGNVPGSNNLVRHKTLEGVHELVQEIDKHIGMAQGADRNMLVAMKARLQSNVKKLKGKHFLPAKDENGAILRNQSGGVIHTGGKKTVENLFKAIDLSHKAQKLEIMEGVMFKNDRFWTKRGSEKIRTKLEKVLKNDANAKLFDEKERAVIERAAKGSTGKKILETLSHLTPDTLKGLAAQIVIHGASGGTLTIPMSVLGGASRVASNVSTKGAAKDLIRQINSGIGKEAFLASLPRRRRAASLAAIIGGGQAGK